MKIKIQQFLFGQNHSWSVCGKEFGRTFINNGYDVDLVSTDGIVDKFIDADLKDHIKVKPDGVYDMQLSYTAMHNFPNYLSHGVKNRFGIWNYEFDILPTGMAKYIAFVDKFIPSSKFFYDICVKNGVPKDKMEVVPHGVDWNKFQSAVPLKLKTNKKYKLFVNFGQPHIRKNIPGTLEAFGRAFTNKDDVCLVIKAVDKKPTSQFEISFSSAFNNFKKKFPQHAECLVITEFIPKIEELYKSCDALFMLPHAEAFFLPALEMLASGGLVITSNYGGQLDFLNHDNSILIDGKMIRAPREAQYWTSSAYASMFEPNLNMAADKLQYCIKNMDAVKSDKLSNLSGLREIFSWEASAKKIIGMCK